MKSWSKVKIFLFIPALALGVALFALQVKNRQEPKQSPLVEPARAVRVLAAPEVSVTPRALGYGIVQPTQVWEAVAEVSGRVIERHADLKSGALIRRGEIMLKIDPTEHQLALDRAEADIKNLQAKLDELAQREKNHRRLISVEEESLAITRKELERKKALAVRGTVSKSEVDQEEKKYLSHQNTLQNLRNSLNLVPTERQALQANLAVSRSRLENARLDLGKTIIKAPFDCRLNEVNLEVTQFVKTGQVLIKAEDIGQAEVLTQVPIWAMRNLINPTGAPLPIEAFKSMEDFRTFAGISAVVRLAEALDAPPWPARFSRTGYIDPQTRTLGVYVAVDQPYQDARPGFRPPLIRNMYCEVELIGRPRPPAVIVPRSAIHEGVVYLVDAQERLKRQGVKVDFTQGDLAVIKTGLSAGQRIVLNDLVPAIDGQLLKPLADQAALETLLLEASGKTPLK